MKKIKQFTFTALAALITVLPAFAADQPARSSGEKSLSSMRQGALGAGKSWAFATPEQIKEDGKIFFDLIKNKEQYMLLTRATPATKENILNQARLGIYDGIQQGLMARYKDADPIGLKIYANKVLDEVMAHIKADVEARLR